MMQVTKVWWDGEKLMAEPIDPASVYKDPEQPAQQEPVAKDAYEWGVRLNDASWAATEAWDKTLMGPMSGAVFNNIKGVVRAAILRYLEGHSSPPAQRKPLTYDQAMALTRGALNRLDVVRKTEAAHNIKEQQ